MILIVRVTWSASIKAEVTPEISTSSLAATVKIPPRPTGVSIQRFCLKETKAEFYELSSVVVGQAETIACKIEDIKRAAQLLAICFLSLFFFCFLLILFWEESWSRNYCCWKPSLFLLTLLKQQRCVVQFCLLIIVVPSLSESAALLLLPFYFPIVPLTKCCFLVCITVSNETANPIMRVC